MKKNLILISLLSLSLASCQGETKNSASVKPSASEPKVTEPASSSQSSSQNDTKLDFNPAATVTSLFDYLNTTARSKEDADGVSYSRKYSSFELGYYSEKTTEKEEEGIAFSNDAFLSSGKEKETISYEYQEGKKVSEDTYLSLSQVEGNTYYSILDYGNGKEKDKASKEEVKASNKASYQSKTKLNALDIVYTFYKDKISKNIISGADDITPEIKDGKVSYHLTQSWKELIGDEEYKMASIIDLAFDKEGKLISYQFDYQEYLPDTDENSQPTDKLTLLSEIKDERKISFGSKAEYSYASLLQEGKKAVNPTDYFRKDYQVILQSWDGVGTEKTNEQNNSFPVGRYVNPVSTAVIPEKALDTKLEVVKSSNADVISISSAGVVKANKVGETTLTIRSKSGIEKTVDVKVVSPSLTSIKANTYSSYHYLGDTETLYIFKTPSNSLEEIEVVSLTSDVIEVVKDKDGDYALHNIGLGEGKVEIRSKTNSKVKTTVSYLVQNKKTIEEVKQNVVGTWVGDVPNSSSTATVKDAFTVVYKNDGTGSLTLNKEGTGYTFEIGKAYAFTYTFLDGGRYTDRPISLTRSTIVLNNGAVTWTYSANAADFYYTGENANIIFATGNSEEFGAMVQLSARRIS